MKRCAIKVRRCKDEGSRCEIVEVEEAARGPNLRNSRGRTGPSVAGA